MHCKLPQYGNHMWQLYSKVFVKFLNDMSRCYVSRVLCTIKYNQELAGQYISLFFNFMFPENCHKTIHNPMTIYLIPLKLLKIFCKNGESYWIGKRGIAWAPKAPERL